MQNSRVGFSVELKWGEIEQWSGLLVEAVESPSLKVSETQLDVVLHSLI